jgi:hypothetical protein
LEYFQIAFALARLSRSCSIGVHYGNDPLQRRAVLNAYGMC